MATQTNSALHDLDTHAFFEITGPDGQIFSCQWERPFHNRPIESFEIVTPEHPHIMGRVFGRFIRATGAFRLDEPPAEWHGAIDDIIAIGDDWDWDREKQCLRLAH